MTIFQGAIKEPYGNGHIFRPKTVDRTSAVGEKV